MFWKLIHSAWLYLCALLSIHNATKLNDDGKSFNRFGRKYGWKLIRQLDTAGFEYIINPVNATRYFEFPFALTSLPDKIEKCLDVGSPRLFSFYVSESRKPTSIWMINPDEKDIKASTVAVKKMNYLNIRTDPYGVDILENTHETFDAIWSISVIEHINGKYDDMYAVKLMYQALARNGHLILTIPVDRKFWEEYRGKSYYGNQKGEDNSSFFFQRYYDESTIWGRLVDTIGVKPALVRWFGEKTNGFFDEYEKKWMHDGLKFIVNNPVIISENFQEYPSWESMPGKGVCGLVFKKPNQP